MAKIIPSSPDRQTLILRDSILVPYGARNWSVDNPLSTLPSTIYALSKPPSLTVNLSLDIEGSNNS